MNPEHHPVHERPAAPPSGLLSVTTHRTGDVEVVTLAGEIDMATGPQVQAAIERGLAAGPQVLVVDLTAVTFLSSTGLTVLVQAGQDAGERTSLRVVATHDAVLHPIELTGLDAELAVFPSLEQALAELLNCPHHAPSAASGQWIVVSTASPEMVSTGSKDGRCDQFDAVRVREQDGQRGTVEVLDGGQVDDERIGRAVQGVQRGCPRCSCRSRR